MKNAVLILMACLLAWPLPLVAATTEPAERLRPFTAFAWTRPGQRLKHVVPMIPFSPGTPPWAVARAAAEFPADERVLLLVQLSKLIWNDPADIVRGPGGKTYQGPWLDGGAARAADWFTQFLTAFRFAKGSMLFLAQDTEVGLSMWSTAQPQIDAIAADPRWRPIAARIGSVARAADQTAWPMGARYNTAESAIIAGYLHRAIAGPLHQTFPDAGTSEFGNALLSKALAARAPDLNNCIQPCDPPLQGTVASPAFYGDANNLAQQSGPAFAATPLPSLLWQTGNARAYRLANHSPILPWVPAKSWKNSRLAGTPYYDELLFHVMLCSETTNLLLWNTTTRMQFHDDNATVDHRLAELAEQLHGQTDFHCITLDAVPYDAPVLISGVRTADGARLFRITVGPGQTHVSVTLPGETTPTTVDLPPGQVGAWISRR